MIGNEIGLWTNGITRYNNYGDGIRLIDSISTLVGGTFKNFIAGNGGIPIFLSGGKDNTLQNNQIGIAADNVTVVTNGGTGLFVENSSNNFIYQNIISGNGGDGICITGSSSVANYAAANTIGLAPDRITIVPNLGNGIKLFDAPENTIGEFKYSNTIGGNKKHGILIKGAQAENLIVTYNKIGIGNSQKNVGNVSNGIFIVDAGNIVLSNNYIGGNGDCGIKIMSTTEDVLAKNIEIIKNFVGYYYNDELSNVVDGIQINNSMNNYIGLSNVVANNGRHGINIVGKNSQQNIILGNFIGTDFAGDVLPNLYQGIQIDRGSNNRIGFTNQWSGNIIANNGINGVNIAFGINNSILGNSIYDNFKMGINLGIQGRNSGYDTNAPNHYQPYPVLNGAYSGSVTRIVGSLSAESNSTYLLEFFTTPNTNISGYGEGKSFVGREHVTTLDDGNINFSVEFSAPVEIGQIMSIKLSFLQVL